MKWTAFTVPAAGATIACSIFIASITIKVCPALTESPTATETDTTRPGSGDVKRPLAGPLVGPLAGAAGGTEEGAAAALGLFFGGLLCRLGLRCRQPR